MSAAYDGRYSEATWTMLCARRAVLGGLVTWIFP